MTSMRVSLTLLVALTLSLAVPVAAQPISGPEFIPLATPCRALDTRTGMPLQANVATPIQIGGVCGVPTTAVAAALNFTIVQPQGPGWLTAWPEGVLPLASVVNFVAGESVANAVDMSLGAGGTVMVQSSAIAHLVVDVYGYFTDVEELGNGNTALGDGALASNTTGQDNTATGVDTLVFNTTGQNNTATGWGALFSNTTGSNNTALGNAALGNKTTGDGNIAIGAGAGVNVTTGSNNIHIGNRGTAADTALIRIGSIQTATFIAGIRGVPTGVADALGVLVDSAGQLGTTNSSRRVKTDIHDLGDQSRALHQLRPVSFRYRSHPPDGPLEYGLIAEEVAEIYPDLVVRDTDGQPSGVRYHVLPAMLLNELQRQQREIAELRAQVRALIDDRKAAVRE